MSSNGHRATAAGLATIGLLIIEPLAVGVIFAIGCLAGSRAPDWMEIVWFQRGRKSLIPHRTVTHWPPLWLGALSLVILLPFGGETTWFATGFILGGLLHLATDLLTPTGIPLLTPHGRRTSLNLFYTGGPGELAVTAAVWVLPALTWLFLVGG